MAHTAVGLKDAVSMLLPDARLLRPPLRLPSSIREQYHAFRWTLELPCSPRHLSAGSSARAQGYAPVHQEQLRTGGKPADAADKNLDGASAIVPGPRGHKSGHGSSSRWASEKGWREPKASNVRVAASWKGLCGIDIALRRAVQGGDDCRWWEVSSESLSAVVIEARNTVIGA